MITKDGTKLLNLESSVQELITLVEGHYEVDRVIADYGITMVNRPLQNPAQLEGVRGTKWGEAYPIGYAPPYDIYIWTRPNIDTTDINEGTWFNVGPMAIPGPQGPTGIGETGPAGESTRWYIGESFDEIEAPHRGDIFLMSANAKVPGDVYLYTENGWGFPVINIRGARGAQGPQGIRGPQGEPGARGPEGPKGDTAPLITLIGIVDSVEEFEAPSAALVGKGYILRTGDIRTAYACIETAFGVYEWRIVGPVSGYSVITSGGTAISQFDADTKLDKDLSTTTYNQAYVKAADGGQGTINITKQVVNDAIPQRQSDGNILVPLTPTEDADAASKKYVDDGLNQRVKIDITQTVFPQVYCKTAAGGLGGTQLRNLVADRRNGQDSWANYPSTVAQRDSVGAVRGPDPTTASQYATKQYVDLNATPKLYQHIIRSAGYGYTADGGTESYSFTAPIISTKGAAITSPFGIWQGLRNNSDTLPVVFCPTEGYDSQGNHIIQITFYKNGSVKVESGYGDQVEQEYTITNIENAGIYDTVSPII